MHRCSICHLHGRRVAQIFNVGGVGQCWVGACIVIKVVLFLSYPAIAPKKTCQENNAKNAAVSCVANSKQNGKQMQLKNTNLQSEYCEVSL